MSFWPFVIIALFVVGFILHRSYSRRQKRKSLLETPLTAQQRHVLEQLVPLVRRLPDHLRLRLEGKINLFLDQVTFRGQNGIEVGEEMKLSIAAQACILIRQTMLMPC